MRSKINEHILIHIMYKIIIYFDVGSFYILDFVYLLNFHKKRNTNSKYILNIESSFLVISLIPTIKMGVWYNQSMSY